MKTLRLTKLESTAYAAGERCFWRAMKPKPLEVDPGVWHWEAGKDGRFISTTFTVKSIGRRDELLPFCPYGTPGDRIGLREQGCHPRWYHFATPTITAITVTQRDGKWGWLVEVGQ